MKIKHKIDFAKKLFNYENTGRKKAAVPKVMSVALIELVEMTATLNVVVSINSTTVMQYFHNANGIIKINFMHYQLNSKFELFRNISEEIMITDGTHTYQTKGSCARTITYTAKEGKIYDIQFNGGCNGNLKMLSKLLEGMDAEEIVKKCGGNLCGAKNTSCADQLAKALSE